MRKLNLECTNGVKIKLIWDLLRHVNSYLIKPSDHKPVLFVPVPSLDKKAALLLFRWHNSINKLNLGPIYRWDEWKRLHQKGHLG